MNLTVYAHSSVFCLLKTCTAHYFLWFHRTQFLSFTLIVLIITAPIFSLNITKMPNIFCLARVFFLLSSLRVKINEMTFYRHEMRDILTEFIVFSAAKLIRYALAFCVQTQQLLRQFFRTVCKEMKKNIYKQTWC